MRTAALIGLVLALAIVGLLAKRQLSAVAVPVVPAGQPADGGARPDSVRAQGRQIEQQFKQSLDAAMQQRRIPDDQ